MWLSKSSVGRKVVMSVSGAALVLFLLDIAARKFKWKWPHEIIRDSKKTRALKNGTK